MKTGYTKHAWTLNNRATRGTIGTQTYLEYMSTEKKYYIFKLNKLKKVCHGRSVFEIFLMHYFTSMHFFTSFFSKLRTTE